MKSGLLVPSDFIYIFSFYKISERFIKIKRHKRTAFKLHQIFREDPIKASLAHCVDKNWDDDRQKERKLITYSYKVRYLLAIHMDSDTNTVLSHRQ